MLQLRIAGTDKLLKALTELPKKTQSNTVKALTKAGHLVEREAKKNISGPVLKRQTGTLASSIRTQVDKAKLEARVGTNVIYGPVHEFGATIPAHDIVPRHAKALRWKDLKGRMTKKGKLIITRGYVFAKKVHIPQITLPPRPWLGPAFKQSREAIKQIFRDATGAAIDEVTKR